jgi:hypothetical protein
LNDAVIVDVVRLAAGKGKPGGVLAGCHPVELLARVLSNSSRATTSTLPGSTM